MVLVLLLVSGIVIGFMIDRHSSQALSMKRQLDSYTFHHVSRGIQEAVEAWIRSNGTNNVAEALDETGLAFDLEVDGGQVVHIYFNEAQDTVLAEFAGLQGTALDNAVAVLEKLKENEGPRARQYVRREGPVAVSANSAPPPVLAAAIGTVLDSLNTDSVVGEIMAERKEGQLDAPAMTRVFDRVQLTTEDRQKLMSLLSTQPILWQVVAEAEPEPGQLRPTLRYGGLAIISPSRVGRDQSTSLARSTSIISWEDLSNR